jgi:hypothetical protein
MESKSWADCPFSSTVLSGWMGGYISNPPTYSDAMSRESSRNVTFEPSGRAIRCGGATVWVSMKLRRTPRRQTRSDLRQFRHRPTASSHFRCLWRQVKHPVRDLLALVSEISVFRRAEWGRGVVCESLDMLFGVEVLVLTRGDCGCAFAAFRRFISVEMEEFNGGFYLSLLRQLESLVDRDFPNEQYAVVISRMAMFDTRKARSCSALGSRLKGLLNPTGGGAGEKRWDWQINLGGGHMSAENNLPRIYRASHTQWPLAWPQICLDTWKYAER